MHLRADDRALAVQVGVTILLGFVVLAIAAYQVQVVPQQNARVEFSHSQTVQGQLQDVRGAVVSVPGGGPDRSVAVRLGTRYPERTIFVNPSAPGGQLRATDSRTLTIENVTAVGAAETEDFWTGANRTVETRALLYQPDYNVYQNGPTTVVENTVVFDRTPRSGTPILDSDQRIVDGRRITIVAMQGAYQEASTETVSVDVRGLSTSTRTVTVTGKNDDNVTLTVPTRLSASVWEQDLLGDERNVLDVSDAGGNRVEIVLDGTANYELRMAKVGLTNSVDEPGPAYLTDVDGTSPRVDEGTNRTLVVEVRDRFNNPVSGISVNASTARPDAAVSAGEPSDNEGRVALEYAAPPDVTGVASVSDQVNVSFSVNNTNVSGFDPRAPENLTLSVAVDNADGSGTGGGGGAGGAINPGNGVVLNDATIQDKDGTVDVVFENLDSGVQRNITDIQYAFFSVDSQGGSGAARNAPSSVDIRGTPLQLRGQLRTISPKVKIAGGTQETVTAEFSSCVEQGDFFVLTTVFENGQTVQYFVAPTGSVNCGGSGGNTAPTADADGPYTVDEGSSDELDGTGSTDPDGSISSYSWTITNDPTGGASLSNADTETPTFNAPSNVGSDRDVTVELTVEDNKGATDTDTTTVTVADTGGGGGNSSPVINGFSTSARGRSGKLMVYWNVSDADGDLNWANLTVKKNSSGTVVDSASRDISGSSASGSTEFELEKDTTYDIVLNVADANGNEVSETRQQTTSGNNSGGK